MKTLPPELESKLVLDTDDPQLPSIAELQAQDKATLEAYIFDRLPDSRRGRFTKRFAQRPNYTKLFWLLLVGGPLVSLVIMIATTLSVGPLIIDGVVNETALEQSFLPSVVGGVFLFGGVLVAEFLAFYPVSLAADPEVALKLMWTSRLEKLREWAKATDGDYITLSEAEALLYKLARKA